jgi:hypothetical protein
VQYIISLLYCVLQQIQSNGEENLLVGYYAAWTTYNQGCNYLNQLYGLVEFLFCFVDNETVHSDIIVMLQQP